MRASVLCIAAALASACAAPHVATRESFDSNDDPFPPSEMATTRFASVATDAPACSEIGTTVLAVHGGSVVDATIACLLCTGIVNRHSMGVGGGFFMTIYATPNNKTEKEMMTLLARELAPLATHKDTFTDGTHSSLLGGMAIATPGEIAGYRTAWKKFGKIPWHDLFRPTINMLREGYPVSKSMAAALIEEKNHIKKDPNLGVFLREDGEVLEEGDLAYDLNLARTLERIAEGEDFYSGALAKDIVDDIADYGGVITLKDLQKYRPRWRDTVQVKLENGDLTVHGPPAPSSGAVLHYIMSILDGYNFNNKSVDSIDSKILTYHRMMEAFKFAYAKRSSLGDEEFVDVAQTVSNMTSPEFAVSIREKISDSATHNISYYEPDFEGFSDDGTTHISLLAADGSAASATSTINTYFGSKVRGKRTGIVFNNEMDDFSVPGTKNHFGVPASPANYISPLKMPMSSMCPTLVTDAHGRVVFISGGSGGSRITTSTAFVMIHNLWFGDRLDVATDRPRIHHQLAPNHVVYEPHVDKDLLRGLQAKGHELYLRNKYMAVVQSIHNACAQEQDHTRPKHCIYGVSDGRKGGQPDGY